MKWLYNNLEWFSRMVNRLAFDSQSKPVDFDKLEQAFIDSNGRKYYQYADDMDIPIIRRGKLDLYLRELQRGLTDDELTNLMDLMEKSLDEGKGGLAKVGFLLEEMKARKEILLHEEILFKLVGCLYIREDQNPSQWDWEIEQQKLEQFKIDSQGGLRDFFYNAGLNRYLPYLDKLDKDWKEYFLQSQDKVKAINAVLKMRFSGQKSSKKSKMTNTN